MAALLALGSGGLLLAHGGTPLAALLSLSLVVLTVTDRALRART
ncbi:hypothetical protein ACH427_03035 [Streptomyces sp. NPDC020379]